jgi:hypothetical protein
MAPANCIRLEVGYTPTFWDAYLNIDTSDALLLVPPEPVGPKRVAKPGTYVGVQTLAAVGKPPAVVTVVDQYAIPGVGAISIKVSGLVAPPVIDSELVVTSLRTRVLPSKESGIP